MATHGLPDVSWVLFDGVDVTGIVNEGSDSIENVTEDVQVAGASVAQEAYVGVQSGSVNLSGFYDSVITDTLEEAAAAVLMYTLEGNTAGKYCQCIEEALPKVYDVSMGSNSFHKAKITYTAQGEESTIDRALIVAPLATRTDASGNTDDTYVDGIEETTGGARFYVAVPDLTLGGYTNLQLQLRDSADHITFANVTGAVATLTEAGAAMIEVDGTIARYQSIGWSYTGAGADQTCKFVPAVLKLAA
jgi:hypothetical protein